MTAIPAIAPAGRRAIATALLMSRPNIEQVGRAIQAIRQADAEEHSVALRNLGYENKALRTALHTVIKELSPEQSTIVLTELDYLAGPPADGDAE